MALLCCSYRRCYITDSKLTSHVSLSHMARNEDDVIATADFGAQLYALDNFHHCKLHLPILQTTTFNIPNHSIIKILDFESFLFTNLYEMFLVRCCASQSWMLILARTNVAAQCWKCLRAEVCLQTSSSTESRSKYIDDTYFKRQKIE